MGKINSLQMGKFFADESEGMVANLRLHSHKLGSSPAAQALTPEGKGKSVFLRVKETDFRN